MLELPVDLKPSGQGSWRGQTDAIAHYQTQNMFFKSIRNGCAFCYSVFITLLDSQHWYELKDEKLKWNGGSYLIVNSENAAVDITASMQILSKNVENSVLGMQINLRYAGSEDAIPMSMFPVDPAFFKLATNFKLLCTSEIDIKPWLSSCLASHECGKNKVIGYVPPRLLQIHSGTIKLIETANLKLDCTQYAALSYCWGPSPVQIKLTTSNIKRFLNGIRTANLPLTFRDAICVSTKLDIKYLWIDSLCIIQEGDAQNDWIKHISQMPIIYSSCTIQIAAAHSRNADGGCFTQRAKGAMGPVILPPPVVKTSSNSSFDPLIPPAYLVLPDNMIAMSWFWVNSRGWVFQERLLSPRTAYYDRNHVYWECSSLVASDIFPRGFDIENPVESGFIKKHESTWCPYQFFARASYDWNVVKGAQFDDHWEYLVREYSWKSFTQPQDKLIAFGFIAQKLCFDYIAGYPKFMLPKALLWRSTGFKPKISSRSFDVWDYLQILNTSRAPTWSWAAIPHGIDTMGYDEAMTVDTVLIDSEVHLVDSTNPYGAVQNASIKLIGPTFKIVAGNMTSKLDANVSNFSPQEIEITDSTLHLHEIHEDGSNGYVSGAKSGSGIFHFVPDLDFCFCDTNDWNRFTGLLIGRNETEHKYKGSVSYGRLYAGLLLTFPHVESKHNAQEYMRVGWFSIEYSGPEPVMYQNEMLTREITII
jgi:hypothetical protein